VASIVAEPRAQDAQPARPIIKVTMDGSTAPLPTNLKLIRVLWRLGVIVALCTFVYLWGRSGFALRSDVIYYILPSYGSFVLVYYHTTSELCPWIERFVPKEMVTSFGSLWLRSHGHVRVQMDELSYYFRSYALARDQQLAARLVVVVTVLLVV
jgi:hypothetical protein